MLFLQVGNSWIQNSDYHCMITGENAESSARETREGRPAAPSFQPRLPGFAVAKSQVDGCRWRQFPCLFLMFCCHQVDAGFARQKETEGVRAIAVTGSKNRTSFFLPDRTDMRSLCGGVHGHTCAMNDITHGHIPVLTCALAVGTLHRGFRLHLSKCHVPCCKIKICLRAT